MEVMRNHKIIIPSFLFAIVVICISHVWALELGPGPKMVARARAGLALFGPGGKGFVQAS